MKVRCFDKFNVVVWCYGPDMHDIDEKLADSSSCLINKNSMYIKF